MKEHQATICIHVARGAMPEVVIIQNALLEHAICFDCADAFERDASDVEILQRCTLFWSHEIPSHVVAAAINFAEDGTYQLLEGEYCRQPDYPEVQAC
jgi:hypothetical protein